jgi:hypothetical protein
MGLEGRKYMFGQYELDEVMQLIHQIDMILVAGWNVRNGVIGGRSGKGECDGRADELFDVCGKISGLGC